MDDLHSKTYTACRTKTYAVCPHCGEDAGAVDHVLGRSLETAWYCESCGGQYGLRLTPYEVEVTRLEGRMVKTADVLRLDPQAKPVYFVVPGRRYEPADPLVPEEDRHAFYYEEHSCPVNWLKPVMVFYDGDTDPHGLIQFVSSTDARAMGDGEAESVYAERIQADLGREK